MQIKENVQFLHSALRRRKVDSTIETSIAELQLVDATLNILLKEGANGSNMKVGHEQLEALEIAIEGIEITVESLFRSMIKTRTSFLNILSHRDYVQVQHKAILYICI
ncbi:uncharacterized protein DS421_19g664210 [Arachis hypogaea]|uniref:Uncharacterized protein n=1 Tax=Arachis hypogaea TaxID=3818 RepID=A0A6B9VCS4_ARAHY|nr:uncharacterized protein DS421_19g664210 [Arachis hypogaea]